jgi:branched-chain amino acid transport system substrate-binding protein
VKELMKKSLLMTALAGTLAALIGCGCSGDKTTDTTTGGTTGTPSTTGTDAPSTRTMPTAAGNTASGDTIKVGLVASLTGDLKPWGADCEQGAKLAVEEFNAAGGVNGKKIELLIQDSQSTPEKGKTAAEKLMSDGSIALIGEVASGITAQMGQSAFEKGVPVMAVGATRTDLSAIGANMFRVCYIDDFQGPVVAKFAYEELGLRNIAILTDTKQPYSVGLSESFKNYFEKLGGKVVDEQKYESQQTQFSSQLTALKSKNPDGLFLSGYFNEVGPLIRQANEMGIKGPYLGGDGWDSREIITNAGEAIKNGYFCNHYNNDEDRPEVKKFLATWKAKYGSLPATTMGALGYDATMVTLNGLKNAKELNSKSLIEALENTENFAGVSGAITLKGKNGDPPKRALIVGLDPVGMKQVFKKAYDYFEAN